MNEKPFRKQFEALVEKYAELLTGDSSPEVVEKVKIFALYSHISKAMPPLASHWNQSHPEAREEIRKIFEEVKRLNEEHRASSKKE